jgi:cyclohexadienyl dehydratase
MKRFAHAAVLGAALALAGFGPAQAQQQKSALNKVLDSGVLRVGTTGDFKPMSWRNPDTNQFEGHQIDLANRLAQDLGVKAEFVLTDWKTLINGVVADKYDVIMTGTSMNVPRAKSAGFTIPWGLTGFMPLVQKKNADKYKSWDDLNNPSVTIGFNLGTTFAEFVEEKLPKAKVKKVESPARDWQELLAGRVDVTMTSILEGAELTQRYPNLTLLFPDQVRNALPVVFMTRIDDFVWINFLNNWLSILKQNGYMAEMNKKWNIQGQPG